MSKPPNYRNQMSTTPVGPLVGAIDEGTSSARFILFKLGTSEVVAFHQLELEQITPREGWAEQDALRLLEVVTLCMAGAVSKLEMMGGSRKDILTIGITNQRETTIVWDKNTGQPLHNAILWLDTRTTSTVDKLKKASNSGSPDNFLKPLCGLPLNNYFSGVKLHWLMENVPEVKKAIDEERCLFGTVDSWLIWNLTGNHITDVSNASRTMLMNINTLQWDPVLLEYFAIPRSVLPTIRSSSELYGHMTTGPLVGVPVSGCLGDQQAALLGQQCTRAGEAKATYGTGCFILYNTGDSLRLGGRGLITTVAWQLGTDSPPCYALEGSVAVAGLVVDWLKSNMGMLSDVSEIEPAAEQASELGSVTFVPAFSGLFAPHWDSNARGVICGITENSDASNLIKASLEGICLQVRDIVTAMSEQCGIEIQSLKVDGGMSVNNLLMQMQADIAGFEVVKSGNTQSTALGAAMAAQWGIKATNPQESFSVKEGRTFTPKTVQAERGFKYEQWSKALERAKNWIQASF